MAVKILLQNQDSDGPLTVKVTGMEDIILPKGAEIVIEVEAPKKTTKKKG